MIASKKDLEYYLQCDKIALGQTARRPKLFGDEIWKFEICMRKLEYFTKIGGVLKWYYRFKYHSLSLKLGFSIPCNVFGPGLAIVHYGTIIVSSEATAGENCRIHAGVNIGANAGEKKAAVIGNNVYIGPGAKIIGNISIGNNAVIGANAVVTKDVANSVTVGGIPAEVISGKDSGKHLVKATEIIRGENEHE